METPGFRWAPSTFLEQDSQDFNDSPDEDTALLTEEGTRIKRSCIISENDLHFPNLDQDYLVREGADITFLFYDNEGIRGGTFSDGAIILNHTGSMFQSYIRAVLVVGLNQKGAYIFVGFRDSSWCESGLDRLKWVMSWILLRRIGTLLMGTFDKRNVSVLTEEIGSMSPHGSYACGERVWTSSL